MTKTIPIRADTVILGGGTGGAVAAGLIAEQTEGSVVLIEAGPDYGALAEGRWPADLLDARTIAPTHSWGYASGTQYADRQIAFQRARVIGGCSSHNGCAAIWGSRLDYDAWAAAGNDGWATDDLLPFFQSVNRRLRVRIPERDEVQPFQRAWLDAAPAVGIPHVADLNDLDQTEGIAPSPVNVADGIRWNSALGYLDPVRNKPNLTVIGDTIADRVLIRAGRVVGVVVIGPDGPATIETERVVLGAGTYGSPGILMRSGIGDPDPLRAIGIEPVHRLPGVGRNLHDHPAAELAFAGSPGLIAELEQFAAERWLPEEQVIAKTRSSTCSVGFDIHIYPVASPYHQAQAGQWTFVVPVACMTPRSRGSVRLVSDDPAAAPLMEHRYLSDPDRADLGVLIDAVRIVRECAVHPSLAAAIGSELAPGLNCSSDDDIADWIERTVLHYYHPVGTCKMGPASDAEAVVDARGKVHGVVGLYVADASLMPVVPRANTNVPAAVVAERVASWLIEEMG